MQEIIYFSKVKPDAIIPTKREEDGCYDIYACFGEDTITICPLEIKLIPTGIASACSTKYRFALRERGSSGTKGLAYRAGQIDSGYRGEWFVPINNTTNKYIVITKDPESVKINLESILNLEDVDGLFTIYPYTKAICQVALEEVPIVNVQEITYEELKDMKSERGTNCLGSSGK
jgi:dUTP pyrophosphatase